MAERLLQLLLNMVTKEAEVNQNSLQTGKQHHQKDLNFLPPELVYFLQIYFEF